MRCVPLVTARNIETAAIYSGKFSLAGSSSEAFFLQKNGQLLNFWWLLLVRGGQQRYCCRLQWSTAVLPQTAVVSSATAADCSGQQRYCRKLLRSAAVLVKTPLISTRPYLHCRENTSEELLAIDLLLNIRKITYQKKKPKSLVRTIARTMG